MFSESGIISNGYLFEESLVERASSLWKLREAQIAVDGVGDNHNRIKAFVSVKDNPYERILKNIKLLLKYGVRVNLRMNFDLGNYQDFALLLKDLQSEIPPNQKIGVYATPVLGEYSNDDGPIPHGDDEWMVQKICELNDLSRNAGYNRYGVSLPHLEYSGCSAADRSYLIIGPQGNIYRCLECVQSKDAVGDIDHGITNQDLVSMWRQLADYEKCHNCEYYPWCMKMSACSAGDRCYQLDTKHQTEYTIKMVYEDYLKKGG